MSKAIVTFAVAKATTDMFYNYAYRSWQLYAARHGYELIVLDEPVRPHALTSLRPIVFQKFLVFEHPAVQPFDDVVFVDADIIINYRDSPCIVTQHGGGNIGMTATDFDRDQVDPFEYRAFETRALHTGQENSTDEKLEDLVLRILRSIDPQWQRSVFMNAGVIVMNRDRHAAFLADLFERYDNGKAYPAFEQTVLTYELLRTGNFTRLQDAFNRYWVQVKFGHYPFIVGADADPALRRCCVTTALCNSYFLHFAGGPEIKDDMRMVDLTALEEPRRVFDRPST